ncbi:uncharacterized protein EI90DRAFT_3013011 [Cantharellus anzutake]|uniref:uncharacterized protein n=1 Tax=Cantharellus anzutake TaxID=1750568 RepID=UPI0019071113|nr:uncharacterized protein EI90DRAFT_3013011 [Cantharellus anzutake]KAF8338877.1 hypothetical protein EI90DRAFT_3013011 [Cantharellus anzutake]
MRREPTQEDLAPPPGHHSIRRAGYLELELTDKPRSPLHVGVRSPVKNQDQAVQGECIGGVRGADTRAETGRAAKKTQTRESKRHMVLRHMEAIHRLGGAAQMMHGKNGEETIKHDGWKMDFFRKTEKQAARCRMRKMNCQVRVKVSAIPCECVAASGNHRVTARACTA